MSHPSTSSLSSHALSSAHAASAAASAGGGVPAIEAARRVFENELSLEENLQQTDRVLDLVSLGKVELIHHLAYSSPVRKLFHLASYVWMMSQNEPIDESRVPNELRMRLAEEILEVVDSIEEIEEEGWDLETKPAILSSKSAINYLFYIDSIKCLEALIDVQQLPACWDVTFQENCQAAQFALQLKAFIDANDWSLPEDSPLLESDLCLDVLARRDFRKLMGDNSDNPTIYWHIKPYYIHDWEEGGHNDIDCYLAYELLDDEQIAFDLVSIEGWFLAQISDRLQDNKQIALKAITNKDYGHPDVYAQTLMGLSDAMADDFDVMNAALQMEEYSFEYASDRLRQDPQFITRAIEEGYVEAMLKQSNQDVVLNVLAHNPALAHLVPKSMREDHAFLIQAISRNPSLLVHHGKLDIDAISTYGLHEYIKQHAPEQAPTNPSVYFISDTFYRNRMFLIEVLERNGQAVKYIDKTFFGDHEILLAAARTFPLALMLANNTPLARALIEMRPDYLEAIKHILNQDHDLFQRSFTKYTSFFSLFRLDFLDDMRSIRLIYQTQPELIATCKKRLLVELISEDERALDYVGAANIQDTSFCFNVVVANPDVKLPAMWLPQPAQFQAICHVHGAMLAHGSDLYKDTFEIVKTAITSDPMALRFASPRLKNNKELCLLAVSKNHNTYSLMPQNMQTDPEIHQLKTAGVMREKAQQEAQNSQNKRARLAGQHPG